MEYKAKNTSYVSPGTMGVSLSLGYEAGEEITESGEETSKLVFLTKNKIMPCGQNQY
jgi:hypothetical protein